VRRFFVLLLCIALPAELMAGEFRSTADSSFVFETMFEGEPLAGEFTQFDVALTLQEKSSAPAGLVVTVRLGAADMGDPEMNSMLFDAVWFDTNKFESAGYSSTAIREVSPGSYLATGVLKLKGIQRNVEVPFEWQFDGREARLQGQLSLRRTDFNVGSGEWATDDTIGLAVKLVFDVNLERSE